MTTQYAIASTISGQTSLAAKLFDLNADTVLRRVMSGAIGSSVGSSGAISVHSTAEGGTAKITLQSARQVLTLTGATTDTTLSIPSGCLLRGVSMNVDTTVVDDAGDDTWSAAFITGSTTVLGTAVAAAQNTKLDKMLVPEVATATTEIRFTPNGGNFSSGAVEIVVYYETLTSLANA